MTPELLQETYNYLYTWCQAAVAAYRYAQQDGADPVPLEFWVEKAKNGEIDAEVFNVLFTFAKTHLYYMSMKAVMDIIPAPTGRRTLLVSESGLGLHANGRGPLKADDFADMYLRAPHAAMSLRQTGRYNISTEQLRSKWQQA
ncbi:hypothetical protein OIV83_006130 [Microbotryomycetes sp. JL201]|nr:hypothetical protein OIV83_006130 [Microbotryomycetes sp. JL201]